MTRIALLADIHADADALRDALRQAERLGCTQILCAGDLVGDGPHPAETIELLQEHGVICILGNHDRWKLGREAEGDPDLPRACLDYLRGLPRTWRTEVAGVRVVAWHARPDSDMHGIDADLSSADELAQLLDEAEADVLVAGHTHVAMALEASGGRLVVNPGALSCDPDQARPAAWHLDPDTGRFAPAPEAEHGTFGVLDLPSMEFSVRRASDGTEVEIVRRRLDSATDTPRPGAP